MEKILKEANVNPKVELTEKEYNHLVDLARAKAKKIEEHAREIYEKEGILKIEFDGRFYTKRNYSDGVNVEHVKFNCIPEYQVSVGTPVSETFEHFFTLPMPQRQKIAKMVSNYVSEMFEANFGEHITDINNIRKLRSKMEKTYKRFIIFTWTGWMTALAVLLISTLL